MRRSDLSDWFMAVGQRTEERWRGANRDEREFPAIAAGVLEEVSPPDLTTSAALLEHAIASPLCRPQYDLDASFGHPPLTVYSAKGFYVSLLFWREGTTAIHDHGFGGAFLVVHGRTLHTTFKFNRTVRINGHLAAGDLESERVEIMTGGRVSPIVAGSKFIHSTLHLDLPTVTLVVRTTSDPGVSPQLSYWHPGLAYDPFYRDDELTRKLQLLQMLANVDVQKAQYAARELLLGADPLASVFLLRFWADKMGVNGGYDTLVDSFARRYPALAEIVGQAIGIRRRQAAMTSKLGQISDPDERLSTAMLASFPTVAGLQRAMLALFGNKAQSTAELWRDRMGLVSAGPGANRTA